VGTGKEQDLSSVKAGDFESPANGPDNLMRFERVGQEIDSA
jgi:hypothetical protein